jgi:hypothetical protein
MPALTVGRPTPKESLVRLFARWRSRSTADNVMLAAIAVCVAIALGRAALVAATIPYAVFVNARLAGAADASGGQAPESSVLERVTGSWPFESWWGERKVPFRKGGDYLRVMTHSSPTRTIGCVIGVLVVRDRADGVAIDRVLIPRDSEALYGEPPGTLMFRPDGSTYRSSWGPLDRYVEYFTDVPAVLTDYDPFLTAADSSSLEQRTTLTERTEDFFTASAPAGNSGTWVLMSRQGAQREYLLVPIELTSVGEDR